jgi:tetratricopeptide (TPR) repeat protein
LVVLRFWRTRKYLLVGWFWFVGTLLPVIGLVQFTGSSYADRFTYIPYIGLFIMIAWGLPELFSKWPQRKNALGLLMIIVLTTLGICAHRQVSYWNNGIALFSRSIEVMPNNYLAYNNRGVAYCKRDRWQEAIEDFNRAIRIKPNYAEAHNNCGGAYSKLGRWPEAIEGFREAIRFKPDYTDAHYNLGVAYSKLGRWQEAINAYKQAIRIKPDLIEAYRNRGTAYSNLGRRQEAIEDFSQAIKIKPDFAEVRYNLANELAVQGRCDEAVDQYHAALRLKPDWPACMNNLAFLIATNPDIKNRDTNEAIRLASRACEPVNYKDLSFLDTLAAAYASAGRFSEAVDTANRALNLADAANQPEIKNIIQYHLSFYTQGKPYIEPPPKPLPDSNKP